MSGTSAAEIAREIAGPCEWGRDTGYHELKCPGEKRDGYWTCPACERAASAEPIVTTHMAEARRVALEDCEELVYLWTRDARIPVSEVVAYVTERMARRSKGAMAGYRDEARIAAAREALALPMTNAERRALAAPTKEEDA